MAAKGVNKMVHVQLLGKVRIEKINSLLNFLTYCDVEFTYNNRKREIIFNTEKLSAEMIRGLMLCYDEGYILEIKE